MDSNARSLREGKGYGEPLQASIVVSRLNLQLAPPSSPIGNAQKSLSQERDRWFESGSLQQTVRLSLEFASLRRASSWPMRPLYPATSAARMATSRRSIRSPLGASSLGRLPISRSAPPIEDDQSDATLRISSQDRQRVINRAPPRFCDCNERQVSTQLSRSRRVLRTASMGHEERFPRPRPNGRCGFRKRSLADDSGTQTFGSGSKTRTEPYRNVRGPFHERDDITPRGFAPTSGHRYRREAAPVTLAGRRGAFRSTQA